MIRKIAEAVSTVFYVGRTPAAPGTAGSLVAVVFVWLWQSVIGISLGWTLLVLLVLTLIGTLAADIYAKFTGSEDPGEVVIDEFIGQWIGLLLVPAHWGFWLAAFLLFRIFDIWKPLWIDSVQRWPGGWGIMADDILAGIATLVFIQLAAIFI